MDIYNKNKEKALKEIPEVDVKLLKLAEIMNGKVVTNDYNLNKVAGINGVSVLNINELANCLKPVVLPGEQMTLNLVKQGREPEQAIGYLNDGTMIVVEDEDFIAEFPKLAKFYKDLYPTSELEAMLRKPVNQVMTIVPSLPRGIQDSLKGLAADMVRTGALDSVSTIKALDEFWGTQLSILTGLTGQ